MRFQLQLPLQRVVGSSPTGGAEYQGVMTINVVTPFLFDTSFDTCFFIWRLPICKLNLLFFCF
jgi:hypothetical protein